MIPVTRPALAPLSELMPYLEQAWRTGILTHNGPLLHELEARLAVALDVPDVVCVASGACAMQLALAALDLNAGEIITTAFTFVATASIIRWQRCTPVFADIDATSWNIDPDKIEAAITPRTRAILPVHVFSAPCDVERIDAIAKRNGLKVIYDAAHSMMVNRGRQSVLLNGDISCLSFHATKLFNTGEGGACITRDPVLAARIRRMRFFGFDEHKHIVDDGMNAKMTEIAAALGLANLPRLHSVMANRERSYNLYLELLRVRPELRFQRFNPREYNFSYMPVLFPTEAALLRVDSILQAHGIFGRRYFSPALNTLGVFAPAENQMAHLPVSEHIASRILCLPLYDSLTADEIRQVAELVTQAFDLV